MRIAKRFFILFVLVLTGACNGSPGPASGNAIVVINAPVSRAGALAHQMERGAQLAVAEINAAGGVHVGASRVRLETRTLDSRQSPEQSTVNIREAIRLGAVAVVDEGTGVNASWQIARDAGMPIGIVYQGGADLVSASVRRNVFRMAPTDRGVAFRLAEYLVPKGFKIAILHDDSTYGSGGADALGSAFAQNRSAVAATIGVPVLSTDVAPQILQARQSGATAMLVWARPPILAQAVRAARSTGWRVPIYASTSGEDPLVRQQLSDHPEWVEGLTFASARLTSERGTKPYENFRSAYEKRFGLDRVGVRSRGKEVVLPPDQAMYSYDFVHVLAAAMASAGVAKPGPQLVSEMEQVSVHGANGDERSFNERNHEGVVDDDVFFAVIRSMVWIPVRDDTLSATLPAILQTI
ncbi:MAG: ABC transporter substrate-binding protein [Actinomycetota bacterium]|nr:ABC transporter substrate-binding protein [Actinomycetota bacterium]